MFDEKRFEIMYSQGTLSKIEIIRDKQTGVAYLCTTNGYSGGLCPLLNPDGKPMVYKYTYEEKEN